MRGEHPAPRHNLFSALSFLACPLPSMLPPSMLTPLRPPASPLTLSRVTEKLEPLAQQEEQGDYLDALCTVQSQSVALFQMIGAAADAAEASVGAIAPPRDRTRDAGARWF